MKRYRAHLVVMDVHDVEDVLNEQLAYAAALNEESAPICSRKLPLRGLITLAKWANVELPVASAVEEAVSRRKPCCRWKMELAIA
tara:strand:+ start:1383 stop:1637 length:255 start_codon:yes stop_codon:yes gene_type:complete